MTIERLGEWVEAGLISAEQASAIGAYEEGREAATAGEPSRVPLAAEALAYLGAALVLGGLGTVLSRSWEDVPDGGRVALLFATTAALVAAGWFAADGHAEPTPARRLGRVLWFLSVGTWAWGVGLLVEGNWDGSGELRGIVVAGLLACFAAGLWVVRPSTLQFLALDLGLLWFVGSIAAYIGNDEEDVRVALALMAFGVAHLAVAASAYRSRERLVGLFGYFWLLIGAELLFFAIGWTALTSVAIAAALLAQSVNRRDQEALAAGTIGLFVFVPEAIVHFAGDELGVAGGFLVVGASLLGVAYLASRLRPRSRG